MRIFFGMLTKTYGFTPSQLGVMWSALCIFMSLSLIPLGKLVDKYGGKHFLIISEFIGITVLIGYIVSSSFPEFLVGYGLTGLMASAWYPAYRAYLSNAVQEKQRARVFGDLSALRGLIAFSAPLIGGILYENLWISSAYTCNFCPLNSSVTNIIHS